MSLQTIVWSRFLFIAKHNVPDSDLKGQTGVKAKQEIQVGRQESSRGRGRRNERFWGHVSMKCWKKM